MKLTMERFLQGMTPLQYTSQMHEYRDAFLRVLSSIEIHTDEQASFNALPQRMKVAVFTEDWCGDSLNCTPVLFRLAEETDKLQVRIFLRDQTQELANSFLAPERWGTIPLFVFLTSDMDEVGYFIETAPSLYRAKSEMTDTILQAHPDLPDIALPSPKMSEGTRKIIERETIDYRVAHANDWGRAILACIRDAVVPS